MTFGFGGNRNGPGGGSTNSGSAPSGKSVSKSGGMSPSERNAQGREGTHSGPGNPSAGRSTSSAGGNAGREGAGGGPGGPAGAGRDSGANAGREFSGFGSREGQRAGPGNPSAGGGMAERGGRVGGGGADSKEGDRSLSAGVDPSRFGGRSTPTGFGADAKEGDRSLSAGVDPSRFGPTRGFGAAMGATTAEVDRAAQARAAERTSMRTYDAAVANSAANALRADTASSIRTAENTSMNPYHDALANFLGITRKAEAGVLDPYNRVVAGKKGTPDYADISNMTIDEAADYASKLTGKPSHVVGGYQFKDTTLTGIADEMGLPRDTKMTPEVQSKLAVGLAQRRANQATVNGVIDKDKFAREMAKEWASFATAATGTSFYSKNGIDKAGVSYGEVKAMTDGLVDSGVVGPRRSLSTMGDDPSLTASATGTVPTATRFASTYLGKQIGATGYDPAKNPANARVAAMFDNSEQGDQAAPQQASYTPDPSLTEFPDRPRSGFEKVAAAGLDIGAGLLPGVGLGVGLVNSALSLTGNRTIGERLVDAIATGKGGKGVPNNGDPSRREYQVAESTIPESAKHTTVPTVEDFADSYLSPPDATKYPTPHERYDVNRNTYAGV